MTLTFVNPNPASSSGPAQAEKTDGLTREDLEQFTASIMAGENALARRRDLSEMHKRLMTALAEIDKTAGAEGIPTAARLDTIERGMSSIESALRIELAPLLRDIVNEALEARSEPKRRSLASLVFGAAIFASGIGAGMFYAAHPADVTSFFSIAASTSADIK